MRPAFFRSLEEFYQRDENIFVLTADLGFKLFDNFRTTCPERFYDIGVAEANMIGVAAGLSLTGKNVYCYSIIPFLVMRAFEQIRVDIAYHDLDVKLIGVGGGFTYGLEGFTHFGLEDLALMRSLPNMTVVVPSDPMEAVCLAKLSYEYKGPMYIRLGKTGEPVIHKEMPEFKIGKAMLLMEGKRVAIFAIGSMVLIGKQVADMLSKIGITPTLINMHTLKPLDTEMIIQISLSHDYIFSLEEHNVHCGLGSAIAEVLMEDGYKGRFKRVGISDKLIDCMGDADHLRQEYGLSREKIYEKILKEVK